MRTLVAAGLILAAGLGVFTWASDGWRAVTAEGARRLAVAAHPVTIPGVTMEDMDGHVLHLSQFKGRVVLVEFIYTTCPTICQELGAGFAEVLERVRKRGMGNQARLLSISFDIDNDTPELLRHYGQHHGADGTIWRVARPTSRRDLEALLAAFGVKVVPDPLYGFQHNVAVHVVDREGRLVRIVDTEPDEVVAALMRQVGRL